MPSTFRVADREISDPVEIAIGFCDYFSNLGPSLAEKIPTSNKPFSNFLKSDVVNSVFFPSTYQQEIVEICASLRSGSAAGFDNIHIDVVKQNIDIISKPLTRIINLSLSSGIVPKQLKIARIIPLFKSGDQDLYANYRPVSVLPVFSKFLEKVVYKRLYNFLTKYNILFDNQYGFRKNYSTVLCLSTCPRRLTRSITRFY